MKDPNDPRYKLEVMGKTRILGNHGPSRIPLGEYRADTLIGLMWAVFCHRCWHLWHDHQWMD